MEKNLSFSVMLSLQEISLRKVTVILWSKTNILDSLDKCDVEDKIKDDMSKLELPPLLTEQMKYLVRPIELEISTWRRFLKQYFLIPHGSFDMRVLKYLCWTTLGTLDYRKMAEKLVRHEMFDCVKLFKLACLFCLEDYIPVLWERLPEISKRVFYNEERPLPGGHARPPLEFCWPYILKGKETDLARLIGRPTRNRATFNQYVFEYSASRGNKAATEYFFKRLKNDERETSLFRTTQATIRGRLENFEHFHQETFPEKKFSETIFYLLSLLSREQQIEILKKYSCHVFMSLLDCYWQGDFLDTAGLVWTFFLEIDNDRLVTTVAERITCSNYFSKLFQELFLSSPSSLRKRFVDREGQSGFFCGYFKYQKSEVIKIIFRNVDAVDRKRLLCSERILRIFCKLISRGKLPFVELCLREATLSKEDKLGLKEAYSGFFANFDNESIDERNKMWGKIIQILD